jgi:murein DD-endopeptidase MepM/ murein hydrolase activator NlpD
MKNIYNLGGLLVLFISLLAFTKSVHKTPTISPIEESMLAQISSGYGMRTNPITKEQKMHLGIDFVAPVGTPVLATADGTITHISHSESGYGNQVTITHAQNFKSIYSQLSLIHVELGQKVSQKDVIAGVGNSGTSSGPHLHYEIEINDKKVDPAAYINIKM